MSSYPAVIERDFVAPLPLEHRKPKRSAWSLQENKSKVQSLVSLSSRPKPTYVFTTLKAKKKKDKDKTGPSISVSKALGKQTSVIASLQPSPCGKRFTIANELQGEREHSLSVKHIRNEGYLCEIGDELAIWQTLGPSGTVLELLGQDAKRWGLFVYTSDAAQRFDSNSGRRVSLRKGEIGELHFFNWGRGKKRESMNNREKEVAKANEQEAQEVQEVKEEGIVEDKGKNVVETKPLVIEEEVLLTGIAAINLRKGGCKD